MEEQKKLFRETYDAENDEDLFEGKKPEVRTVKNTYMIAGALVREIVIKKTWVIPSKRLLQ